MANSKERLEAMRCTRAGLCYVCRQPVDRETARRIRHLGILVCAAVDCNERATGAAWVPSRWRIQDRRRNPEAALRLMRDRTWRPEPEPPPPPRYGEQPAPPVRPTPRPVPSFSHDEALPAPPPIRGADVNRG